MTEMEDKEIERIKLNEEREKAENADPDLKYDSLNKSHTATIKRLRHFGKYRPLVYNKAERRKIIKMIQEKNYIALFKEYFDTHIEMLFLDGDLCMDYAWEIGNVQSEIMLSIPAWRRREMFDKFKESVDERKKWWIKGYLKLREEREAEAKAKQRTPEYLRARIKRGEAIAQRLNKGLEEWRKELKLKTEAQKEARA